MLKQFKNSLTLLVAGALILSCSLGCSRNPAGETGLEATESYSQNYDNGSDFNNNPYSDTTNTQTNTGTGYGTDPTQSAINSLSATVMNKDTSLFWIFKRVSATIMVSNTSQSQVSGTLSITYTYDGETTETAQQEISLAAGESKQIEVKSTKKADDIQVTVTPSNSYSYGTSYSSQYQ